MKTKTLLIALLAVFSIKNSNGQTTGLQFDGVDDYAIVQHNNAYDIGYGNFTLEAMVTLDPVQTASNYPALLSTRSSGNDSGFLLFFFNGELSLQTDGQNHNSSPNGDIRDGQCHHVAVVRSSTSLLSWYIDGQLTTTNTDANYDITTSGPMVIGNDFFSGSLSSGPFKGTIQEVRVWNVARSQAQIQTAMSTNLNGNEPGLIGYWSLIDGSGQLITDQSATNNTGTLGSSASADASDPMFISACPIIDVVGVHELSSDGNGFKIYPNPVTSSSFIEFNHPTENAEIVIYDMIGKQLTRAEFSGSIMEIKREELKSGAYFVRVRVKEREYVQKIVIE